MMWFANCPMCGFELHDTAESAEKSATLCASHLADDAAVYGWDENVHEACWGQVSASMVLVEEKPSHKPEFDTIQRWELQPPQGARS